MPTNRFPSIGYKTRGPDFNFFEKTDVSATTFGGDSVDGYQPDMIIPFSTQSVIFINEGSGVVEYSLNGTTIHGELDSSGANSGFIFDNRVVSLIWFRVKTGSIGPITVSVQAWAVR
jgi:hypothetical protein